VKRTPTPNEAGAAVAAPVTEGLDSAAITHLRLTDIALGVRRRKYYNDIEGLAESITLTGLDHPVTVIPDPTQEGKYLLRTGGRRYKAFEFLGRETIPAVIKPFQNLLIAEAAENTQRDGFTIEEMVEHAKTIIDAMVERRGRPKGDDDSDGEKNVSDRTHLGDGDSDGEKNVGDCAHLWPGLKKGEKTADYAARMAGLGSRRTLERAQKVRQNAIPEVWEALNLKPQVISLWYAHEICLQPQDKQLSLLNAAKQDPDTNPKKLAELNKLRRKEKRQTRVGIDPETTAQPDDFPDPMDGYNLIRVAPNFHKSKIETLATFPIRKHGASNTLVCIECKDQHLDRAIALQKAWGLVHRFTMCVEPEETSIVIGASSPPEPVHIVVCGFNERHNDVFEKVKTPRVHHRKSPQSSARDVILEVFGPFANRRMLDVSADKSCAGWTICKHTYGYALLG